MSSEAKAKRSATSSNPPADGDHRKRRRNRTTQSCLNCHTSKRMCDRKRPACARCTQLGLTGLCVYEVDDPNQRSDSQDESARLLKRVAELEGVIRELKNKPHPRWSQSASSGDRWHTRSLGGTPDGQDLLSDTSSSRTPSESGESPILERAVTRSLTTKSANVYPSLLALPSHPRPSSSHSQYHASSPHSTPSPTLMTPTEEFAHAPISIAAQPEMSPDYDISSIFLAYPSLGTSIDYSLIKTHRADEACFIKQHGGHCGCLHESTNYNAVLELSMRLRRAADILARSPSHHIGSTCLLNQRVSDLDTFTTNTLGNMIISHEDMPLNNQERTRSSAAVLPSNQMLGPSPRRFSSKPATTSSLHSWDILPADSGHSLPCDDSFMSWEPHRRTQ